MISRRQFLTRFAAVPIAATILLPSAKSIFLPPRGGWPSELWIDHGVLHTYTFRAHFLAPNVFRPGNVVLPEETLTADSLAVLRQELERNHAVGAQIQLLRDGEASNVVWIWSSDRVRQEAALLAAAVDGPTYQQPPLYREIEV